MKIARLAWLVKYIITLIREHHEERNMISLTVRVVLSCVLLLLVNQSFCAQESQSEKKAATSPFVLRVTYKNRGKKSKHLVKVGIKVSNLSTRLGCAMAVLAWRKVGTYASNFLQPPADYVIHFHVSKEETVIDAEPPAAIHPDEARYITISFFPSTVGACQELLSFEVSGILIFDDGDKVYFTPEQNRITGEEVDKYIKRTPEEAELLAALSDRNIDIRRQAVSQLPKSALDRVSLEHIIGLGLVNEDPGIRAAAAISSSQLKYSTFTKKISELLRGSLSQLDAHRKSVRESASALTGRLQTFGAKPPEEKEKAAKARESRESAWLKQTSLETEIADYCRALGGLQNPTGIDALTSALINVNFQFPDKASDALIQLNHPDVVNKVRPLLQTNTGWLHSKNSYLLLRYSEIVKVIVAYRDMQSVGVLLQLANESDDLDSQLVGTIWSTIKRNRIIRDPFILALRPVYERVRRSHQSDNRISALNILALMPLGDDIIQGYFREFFKDDEVNIRVNAARIAGALGYKGLVDDIRLLRRSKNSEFEKDQYCTALANLGAPCK